MKKVYILLVFITAILQGQGDTLWTKELPYQNPTDLINTNDGGFAMLFNNETTSLVKMDSMGNEEWIKSYGGEYGTALYQTYDGGYAIGGHKDGDFWLIRADAYGDTIWTNTYGGSGYDFCYELLQTYDGGFALLGNEQSFSEGNDNAWLVKTSSNGDTLWSKIYGGIRGNEFIQDSDSGFVITGRTSDYDSIIIKKDKNGDNVWNNNYSQGIDNQLFAIVNAHDYGYVAAGTWDFGAEPSYVRLLKVDSIGYEIWDLDFGDSGWNTPRDIIKTIDNGFLIFASKSDNSIDAPWVIKTDTNGILQWEKIYENLNSPGSEGCKLVETSDGNYVFSLENPTMLIKVSSAFAIPEIEDIADIELLEDSPTTVPVNVSGGTDFIFYVESDTSAVPVYMDENSIAIGLQVNWSGSGNITLIITNEYELSDTTSFQVTVLPVNDAPQDFNLVFPTTTDTIQINTDTDETIPFYWEESVDVDSDVNYLTTVTLDYFGDIFIQEYESDTSAVSISGYEWAILMTNQNLERWTLQYSVKASDEEYEILKEGEFVFKNTSLSIDENISPLAFSLHQNYPNPFNPITTLKYDLPEDSFVDITIYDMLGNVVNNLINQNQNSGYKSIQWDATNNIGQPVSAGLYLYTIQVGDYTQTKKMVLLK